MWLVLSKKIQVSFHLLTFKLRVCEPSLDINQSNCCIVFLVLGWNGQKSILSKSLEEDRKRSNEKSLDDEYDDEFDQGRVRPLIFTETVSFFSTDFYIDNKTLIVLIVDL